MPRRLCGRLCRSVVVLLIAVAGSVPAVAEPESDVDIPQNNSSGIPVPVLTPEELSNYSFPDARDAPPPKVEPLTIGQQFILDAQRSDIKDLITRKVGVLYLKGNRQDIPALQRLVDGSHIADGDVKNWQSLGIVFGDMLAEELDLHWVNFEDELGQSRGLQYRNTANFVFPITMFSRRKQFRQPIDVSDMFEKVAAEVGGYADPMHRRPRFEPGSRPRRQ